MFFQFYKRKPHFHLISKKQNNLSSNDVPLARLNLIYLPMTKMSKQHHIAVGDENVITPCTARGQKSASNYSWGCAKSQKYEPQRTQRGYAKNAKF